MGREIEVKIPLSQNEFMKIMAWILGGKKNPALLFKNPEIVFKTDEYYSQFEDMKSRLENEPRVIRLRTQTNMQNFSEFAGEKSFEEIRSWLFSKRKQNPENAKSFFAVKTKQIQNGIEFNEENETFVENPDVLRQFFARTNFRNWFRKEKIAVGTQCVAMAAENGALLVPEGVCGVSGENAVSENAKNAADKNSVPAADSAFANESCGAKSIPVPGGLPAFENPVDSSKDLSVSENSVSSAKSSYSTPYSTRIFQDSNAQNIRPLEFHLELELVNGLPYVEIEYTKETESADVIRNALDNLIELLSLEKSKKDSRSWVQIIQNA